MIAKTFQGLEEVLAKELVALGANNVQIGRRMVSFTGDKAMMYKANFHLRTAVRILKPIMHFKAANADEVYNVIKSVDWEQYLDCNSTFSVDSVVYSDVFRHSKFVAYRVKDADGSFLAVLLADFHPRANKQSGAWMTTYREQWVEDKTGENVRPIVSIEMNFTKPTKERPALLTLGEVETFLHEFGHALHAIFSQVRYEALSCTNVYWDFVELPSQFMENYATEAEFLNTFARHYQTGEPMPEELIQRIRESRNFQCGYACCRQVSFCLLDMAYYTLSTPLTQDIRTFESQAWEKAMVLKTLDDSCMSVRFGHIMSGGYSAGYYSYKWAEVLDADAFSVFQQEGIFNPDTAARFRKEILSRGCSEHPMTLYKNFRGEEPGIEALLRRNGIGK